VPTEDHCKIKVKIEQLVARQQRAVESTCHFEAREALAIAYSNECDARVGQDGDV
jgi:hypothetical protein